MKQKNNSKYILIAIVIIGIILRILLAVRLEIDKFQIDLGFKNYINDYSVQFYDGIINLDRNYMAYGGHLEYIVTIYNTGHLPETNTNQCYHPPLSQAMFAGFMRLESLFTNNSEFLIESLEFLSIIYSIFIILLSYKIMKEIGFEDKDTILPIAIITFHPLFIFLSRLVNTDGLLSLLILVSILYLIKWYKNPSYKNVIILALSIGLSAMTKTSAVVMALPLIIVFLKKLNNSVEDTKTVIKILIQGILFSGLSLPLVFWYPIRNYYMFGQNLFGVVEAFEDLKVADNSFLARWILNKEFFSQCYRMKASNVWANLIISSIDFGMEASAIPFSISMILRVASLSLIVISVTAIIKFMREVENKELLFILAITYISWVVGYIYFNISMPYSCTIHARYIVTAIIIGIIYIGIFYKNLKSDNAKYVVLGISSLFILLSIIMMINLIVTKGIVELVVMV